MNRFCQFQKRFAIDSSYLFAALFIIVRSMVGCTMYVRTDGDDQFLLPPQQVQLITDQPPTIVVKGVTERKIIYTAMFGLEGWVTDERGLQQVQIRHDSEVIYDSQKDPTSAAELSDAERKGLSFNVRITLREGENRIQIFALDSDNVSTERTFHLIYQP